MLRYANKPIPIHSEIAYYPIEGQKPYKEIRYSETPRPPEDIPSSSSSVLDQPNNKNSSILKRSTYNPITDTTPELPRRSARLKKPPDPKETTEPINKKNTPRRSARLKVGADNHQNHSNEIRTRVEKDRKINLTKQHSRTKWKSNKLVKAIFTIGIGIAFLGTNLFAEPRGDSMMKHSHILPEIIEPLKSTSRIEELRAYHASLDLINAMHNPDVDDVIWKPDHIESHLVRKHKSNGTKEIFFKVEWRDGTRQWVPMNALRLQEPYLVLAYGRDKGILHKPGWEWVDKYLEGDDQLKKVSRIYKMSSTKSYKFGIEVPKGIRHALHLDENNDDNEWENALQKEVNQINEFETFRIIPDEQPMPKGYKRIPYHFVFDVKFDLRRKARLVAGGHMTAPLREHVYSGVVSMEAIRIGFMLAKMNGLQVCAGDIGNAYLNAKTKEKVYVIAGPEFGPEAEGKRMIIDKSLYGLKSSAARFHEHLSTKLKMMGYSPSKADPDLWMKKTKDGHYEYIARYVDDVISFSKDPMKVMKELERTYTMKGVGEPEYYLGGDIVTLTEEWNKEGITQGLSASTYIKNVLPRLSKMCDKTELPKAKTPFVDTYHAELDATRFCTPEETSKYQSLIGSANWIVTLGRFDIQWATTTLARYAAAPRIGHFEAALRIFGYLRKFQDGTIIIDPYRPSILQDVKYADKCDWEEFYSDTEEEIPYDMPDPYGTEASLTVFVDADHARDKVTCRSVTGILILLNNMPVTWFCKRQKTVESSTYGSELVAGRIAIELIIEWRYKLRMLGMKFENQTTLIGDNMSVILNTTVPSSTLKKKMYAIAYHKIRETIAGGFVTFAYIHSTKNVADILTKPLGGVSHHRLLKEYMFRRPLTVTRGDKESNVVQDENIYVNLSIKEGWEITENNKRVYEMLLKE